MDHSAAVKVILEGDVRTRPQHFDPAVLEVFANSAHLLAEAYGKRPDIERKVDGRIASFPQNGENRRKSPFFG